MCNAGRVRPFSHPDQHPQHVERLARYWGEMLGGPPRFTEECSSQTRKLRMHAGHGDMTDLGQRFKLCFARAMDDAGLPGDPEFRAAMNAYMRWAVAAVLAPETRDGISPRAAMPHWDWAGLGA